MTDKDYKIAKKFKNRLAKEVQLVDFKVFGSRARGNADENSDLDVFIEVEFIDKFVEDKIEEIAWEVGFKNFILISPLVFSRNEFENSPLKVAPIVRSIKREGVAV